MWCAAAVLESQAFGPYQPPDYAATLTQQQQQQQAAAGDPLSSGETLQHNLKGADALIAAVGTEALPEAVVEEGHMLQQAQAQQQQQQQQRQPQVGAVTGICSSFCSGKHPRRHPSKSIADTGVAKCSRVPEAQQCCFMAPAAA